jgi:phosphatidate cytidylyltransferase
MLGKRIITALWAIPLAVLAVWFDKPVSWFTILAAVAGLLAVFEFFHLTGVSKIKPLAVFGLVWTLLFIVLPHWADTRALPLLITAGVGLSLILLLFVPGKDGIFQNWARMLAGTFYIGWLLNLIVSLRLDGGRNWVFLALFATFASDTAAYFTGKAIGRHKLAPHISPGKTREGAIAGVIGAMIVGVLFTLSTPFNVPLDYIPAVILGALISVFGQCGDLVESLLKRNTGVKDSGTLMSGHGGLLDRLDSLLFAGAVVYVYYILIVA